MPTNDNWSVTIARDPERRSEDVWIATAKRGDFEFTQKVQGNSGEITEFCKTARTMFKQHEADKAHAATLAEHFDDILEREDQREIEEAEKAKADAEAKAKAEADAIVKAEADRVAAEKTAADAAAAVPVEPTPDAPVAESLTPEVSNETPL